MKKFVIIFLFLMLLTGCGQKKATIKWTAPTDGAPVEKYILLLDGDGTIKTFETSKTSITLKLRKGVIYHAIVAGVSADGKRGMFSEPSDPFQIR